MTHSPYSPPRVSGISRIPPPGSVDSVGASVTGVVVVGFSSVAVSDVSSVTDDILSSGPAGVFPVQEPSKKQITSIPKIITVFDNSEKVQAAESIDRLRSWILLSDLDKTEKKRLCETLTEDDPPISE